MDDSKIFGIMHACVMNDNKMSWPRDTCRITCYNVKEILIAEKQSSNKKS